QSQPERARTSRMPHGRQTMLEARIPALDEKEPRGSDRRRVIGHSNHRPSNRRRDNPRETEQPQTVAAIVLSLPSRASRFRDATLQASSLDAHLSSRAMASRSATIPAVAKQ